LFGNVRDGDRVLVDVHDDAIQVRHE
jgi:hypothetical protein